MGFGFKICGELGWREWNLKVMNYLRNRVGFEYVYYPKDFKSFVSCEDFCAYEDLLDKFKNVVSCDRVLFMHDCDLKFWLVSDKEAIVKELKEIQAFFKAQNAMQEWI